MGKRSSRAVSSPRRPPASDPPEAAAGSSPGNSRADALAVLRSIHLEQLQLDARRRREVARARRLSASWRDVGNALDVTPQAAQKRFGTTPARHSP